MESSKIKYIIGKVLGNVFEHYLHGGLGFFNPQLTLSITIIYSPKHYKTDGVSFHD